MKIYFIKQSRASFCLIVSVLTLTSIGNVSCIQTETDKLIYIRKNPDAPIWLYCLVNDNMNSISRVSICEDIVTGKFSTFLHINGIVENGEVNSVEIQLIGFDKSGSLAKENFRYDGLDSAIKLLGPKVIFPGKKVNNPIVRIELERFCTGVVSFPEWENQAL